MVVLHHGFQGNNLDMLSLKHYFSLKYPKNYYHCAKANEENSEEEIGLMGKKLALEIKEFIQVYVPGRKISKMSFVGHSMGGLIIRASFPHLKEYKHKMGCFMTVSTPHLGDNKGDSKLVEFGTPKTNVGFNILTNWKKSQSLVQIGMKEQVSDPYDKFLYKLSEMEGMNWFRHIVLVSSP